METAGHRPLTEEEAVPLARSLAAQGRSAMAIVEHLVRRGLDRGVATFVVHQRAAAPRPAGAGLTEMAVGAGAFLLGLGVTTYSYLGAAGAGGGRYVLAYGAILFGGLQFVRGLARWSQDRPTA